MGQKHITDMKKRVRKLEREKGFTLLEVSFAIVILTFGLLAVASMQSAAIRGNFSASALTQGSTWAQDRLEKLMALAYTHADLDPAGNPHEEANPPAGYTIAWNVTADNPVANTKLIVVTVRWQDKGVTKTTQLTCVKPQL
jgi:prepilin-type N-terminal cleavage/methylation domain-containing protein